MNELVLKFKDQVMKNMIEKGVLASIQLAYIIINKDNDIDPETLIEDVANNNSLVGVKDYKEACKILASSNKEKNRFIYIIESNKLFTYDNQVLDEKEKRTGESVNVEVEEDKPSVDEYIVKKSKDSDNIISTTNDLSKAEDQCTDAGNVVVDNKGRVIYVKPEEELVKEEKVEDGKPKLRPALVSGASFVLNNTPVYTNASTKDIKEKLTGRYYITDGIIKNDRVRIAKSINDKNTVFVDVSKLDR